MKTKLLLTSLLCAGLWACDDSSEATGSDTSTAGGSAKVVDTVIGIWQASNGPWKGDTVRITKDSMDWKHGMGIYPTKLGVKFYAFGGNMGTTTGQGKDGIAYEYLKSGDTLWIEAQNLADRSPDGKVDRSLFTSYALLPVR
ncbi:MAG: hypothetical protein RL318_2995 [Fibrobacterota bacterium]|jgi:hypothetical protein